MLTNNLSALLQPLHEIQEYCEKLLKSLKPHLESENFKIEKLFIDSDSRQNDSTAILDAMTLEKKINVLELIIKSINEIEKSKDMKSIESILWILNKLRNTENSLSRLRAAIEQNCDSEEVKKRVWNFEDIDPKKLEKYLLVEFSKPAASDYIISQFPQYSRESVEEKLPVIKTNHIRIESLEQHESWDKARMNDKNEESKIDEEREVTVVKEPEEVKPIKNGFEIASVKGINKESLDLYHKIEGELKLSQSHFKDDSFPPEIQSITPSLERFPAAKDLVWRRISEVYEDRELTLCSTEISSDDVVQGRLRNCYFLSTLCVLAKNPNLIKRLFESKEVSSTGCYSIWLCDSGEWKNLIIDDYIPCILSKRTGKPKPYFSRIRGNDIWVCLLEKAFAKLFGSYFGLQGGFQAEAYYALTGAPVKSFHTQSKEKTTDELWTFITQNLEKDHVLTCSCDEVPDLDTTTQGLAVYHSYALLDAKEIPTSKQKVVKLKNPWGYSHWKGDWSDESSCWTAEMKEYLNYSGVKKDGVFWMGFEDLSRYFQHFNACQVKENYKYSFLKLDGVQKEKRDSFVIKMKLLSAGHVYLTVQQKSKRHFRNNNASNYQYSYIRFILAKRTEGKITKLLQAKYDLTQAVFLEQQKLQKGNYLIFIEMEWTQDFHHEIVLTSYSDIQTNFYPKSVDEFPLCTLYSDIFSKYMISKVKEDKAEVEKYQYELEGKKLDIWRYGVKKFGLGMIFYQNREKNLDLHSVINDKEMKNMDLIVSPRDENQRDFVISSQSDLLIIFRANRTDGVDKEYLFKYKEEHNFSKIKHNLRVENSTKTL